jgi:hypothetical protein
MSAHFSQEKPGHGTVIIKAVCIKETPSKELIKYSSDPITSVWSCRPGGYFYQILVVAVVPSVVLTTKLYAA